MGPEADGLDTSKMVVQFQDPATGQWHDLTSAGRFEFLPELPPGSVFGEPVQQIRKGVYEIPDELLRRKGVEELWSFAEALRRSFADLNPDLEVTIERDVVRSSTLFTVTRDGRAPEEDL